MPFMPREIALKRNDSRQRIYFSLLVVSLFICASISRFFTWRRSGKLSVNVILFFCGTPIFPRHCDCTEWRYSRGMSRSMKL